MADDFVAPTIGELIFEAYEVAATNFGEPAINPAGAAGTPEDAAEVAVAEPMAEAGWYG